MDCRFWPPFNEKEIDGKCVSIPSSTKNSTSYDIVGFIGILLVVLVPLFLLTKMKK